MLGIEFERPGDAACVCFEMQGCACSLLDLISRCDLPQIGDGAIVTPNSVVSGRVAENTVVQGNPARPIFTRRA
jgi:hypothetical protein